MFIKSVLCFLRFIVYTYSSLFSHAVQSFFLVSRWYSTNTLSHTHQTTIAHTARQEESEQDRHMQRGTEGIKANDNGEFEYLGFGWGYRAKENEHTILNDTPHSIHSNSTHLSSHLSIHLSIHFTFPFMYTVRENIECVEHKLCLYVYIYIYIYAVQSDCRNCFNTQYIY